jgi:IS30 family transposase
MAEKLVLSVSTIGRKLKRNFGYGTQCYKRSLEQKMKDRHRKVSKRAKNQPITIISFKNYILQYFPKKTKTAYTATYLANCRQNLNFICEKYLCYASPDSVFVSERNPLFFKLESGKKE